MQDGGNFYRNPVSPGNTFLQTDGPGEGIHLHKVCNVMQIALGIVYHFLHNGGHRLLINAGQIIVGYLIPQPFPLLVIPVGQHFRSSGNKVR